MRLAWVIVATCACGKSTAAQEHHVDHANITAAPSYPNYELPGDVGGIAWDAASSTLFLADDTHDAILAWTGAAFTQVAKTPPAHGFGGLVRMADGTFVVAAFGFGTDGGVFTLTDRAAAEVPHLDPKRRRLGIALGPDGALYDSYFVVEPGKKHAGGVARVDLAGSETDVFSTELTKPVGIAISGSTLYVADQDRSVILAYALDAPAEATTIAAPPSVDLLTLLPGGDLVTGGKLGEVYRVTPSGTITTIARGFEQVRATAYDPERHRLFVVEHSRSSSRHKLHVVPLE